MTTTCWPIRLLLLAAALPGAAGASLRDPTEPPAQVRAAASASAPESSDAGTALPRHIIVSNGRAYVVDNGRRLGVGQMLGNARIERITSDAVWLRDGDTVRRMPLYEGVTKRALAAPAAASAPRISSKRHTKKDSQ